MKPLFAPSLAVLAVLTHSAAHAAPQSEMMLHRSGFVFTPSPLDCTERDICDLKEVVFRTERFRLPPLSGEEGDIDLIGTRFYASYETSGIGMLEKYLFVQFIRGCAFYSAAKSDGTMEEEHIGRVRAAMFDRLMIFRHALWSIDSSDPDPAYSTSGKHEGNRHYLLQWQKTAPEWVPDEQSNLYGEAMPTVPRLFMTDLPLAAWYRTDGITQNVSFEFRTCLYKAGDVPTEVADEHDTQFAEPIVCWDWAHNVVYDHVLGRFEHPRTISPVCMRPPTPEEEHIDKILRAPQQVAIVPPAPPAEEK